jgi:hypothetical protein
LLVFFLQFREILLQLWQKLVGKSVQNFLLLQNFGLIFSPELEKTLDTIMASLIGPGCFQFAR